MRLLGVDLFPLKSAAPLPVDSARVEACGLVGDRRWMVVDPDGTLVSAREERRLLAVHAEPLPGGLRVRVGGRRVEVAEPTGPADALPVRLHRHRLLAAEAPDGSAWLSDVLQRPLRLVWCDDPTRRPLNPAYSSAGDHAALQDGYPVTAVTTASVQRLRDWMVETALELGEEPPTFGAERFRANLLVQAEEPFTEDGWQGLRVGDVRLRVAKPIDRCVMTTIDPVSLAGGREPIRTLARHRAWDGATWFGVQLIPDGPGEIRVGDRVRAVGGAQRSRPR